MKLFGWQRVVVFLLGGLLSSARGHQVFADENIIPQSSVSETGVASETYPLPDIQEPFRPPN